MAGFTTVTTWSLDPDSWVQICWPIQNTLQVTWRDFLCSSHGLHQLGSLIIHTFLKERSRQQSPWFQFTSLPPHENISWSKPTSRSQNIQGLKSGIWSHLVLFHLIAEGEMFFLKMHDFCKARKFQSEVTHWSWVMQMRPSLCPLSNDSLSFIFNPEK